MQRRSHAAKLVDLRFCSALYRPNMSFYRTCVIKLIFIFTFYCFGLNLWRYVAYKQLHFKAQQVLSRLLCLINIYLLAAISSVCSALSGYRRTFRGEQDSTKVHFEIGWLLTFRMKVNSCAMHQYVSELAPTMLMTTTRYILEHDHDLHTYVQGFQLFGRQISKLSEF